MNPFFGVDERIQSALQKFGAKLELAIIIRIDREAARVILSRLATLDPERSADYLAAIKSIGEGD